MQKRMIQMMALTLVLSVFSTSWALMPPLTPEELQQESNQIVIGKITAIECTGKIEENKCVKMTGYKTTLQVDKVIKGKKSKTLDLYFKDYDFKGGCVGSPDARHYVGDEGKYYMSCKDQKCYLVNWNGVTHSKRGKQELPKCKKTSKE